MRIKRSDIHKKAKRYTDQRRRWLAEARKNGVEFNEPNWLMRRTDYVAGFDAAVRYLRRAGK